MDRRDLLQIFGVSGAAALAGCGDTSNVNNETSDGDGGSSNVAGERIEIEHVEWSWNDNVLHQIFIRVANRGDSAVRLERVGFTLESLGRDFNPSTRPDAVLEAGASREVRIGDLGEEGRLGGVKVEKLGTRIGTITIETDVETVSVDFSDHLDPALLSFGGMDPNWDGNTMVDATFAGVNMGQLPTDVQISASANGEEVASTPTDTIYPGTSQSLTVSDPESLQTANYGGDAELEFTADSPAGQAAGIISQQIADADLSVDSMSSGWANGQFVELRATLSVNTDTDLSPTAQITIDDNNIGNGGEFTLPANERTNDLPFYDEVPSLGRQAVEPDPYEIRTGGTHEVVLSLELEDESISVSHSKEFDGLDTSFSDIEASFSGPGNGTDDVELSDVKFTVGNGGDVVLRYGSIEIEIEGTSRMDRLGVTSNKGILPGSSEQEHVRLSDEIPVSPGGKELTISLLYKGDEIEQTTTTVTA